MHFSTIITYGDFNDNNVSETLPNSEEQRNNLAFVEKRRNMFKKKQEAVWSKKVALLYGGCS